MSRRLRVGVSWGWNNTVECMANPDSSICLANGRRFERFVLSQFKDQIELVKLPEFEYGVYSNGSVIFMYFLMYFLHFSRHVHR